MNSVTIAVPTRWQPAIFQIKQFVEQYAASHNVHVSVTLTFQLDAGQIYITSDPLPPFEEQVCQNAVSALSDQLNANLSRDAWQARGDVTQELQEQLLQISDLIDSIAPPDT